MSARQPNQEIFEQMLKKLVEAPRPLGPGQGLWESRPTWLAERIDSSYAEISRPDFSGYEILASEEYALGHLAGSDLIATCIADREADGRPPLRLLDIGAGEGRFLAATRRRWQCEAVGISAIAYDAALADSVGAELRLLNAECALASKAFRKDLSTPGCLYDCIVSAETFRHFKDPLGTLCQFFVLLRPGGVLAIDRCNVPGLASGQMLLDWWRRAGFEVHGDSCGERIAPLFLQKAHLNEVLRVPVRYAAQAVRTNDGRDVVYEFLDYVDPPLEPPSSEGASAADGGGSLGKSSMVSLRTEPPWVRARRKAVVPEPQWRQMEGMLKKLVYK
eukprot:gnl/TRDRNA2_/TRDRNA2_56687_c0_seq1.p1 gnl/TRDRNA2_/TRDRNA2_56687_c0~~gnl/TRDRNA2_/TRDRNA2_56687_c0_seq1.p1  ORF type:complete len:333 (+),score=39.97 gnl/TRDRNA2_/TRDRNA2_56687_c0_seq1:84-1082(+)